MEQLGCSPDEARRQLERLAGQAGIGPSELAAQITRQAPVAAAAAPGWHKFSFARAAVEGAPDANAVARAIHEEVLADLGATAVALWRAEPDGGMQLIGQSGLGLSEASRWRRIHPDMRTLQQEVAHTGIEAWWPTGRPGDDHRPLAGSRWPDGARAALPITDAGQVVGTMIVCWPESADINEPLQKQLIALADLAGRAIRSGIWQEGEGDQPAAWVTGLLESLLDGLLILRAVRDHNGKLTDFRLDHMHGRPPSRGPGGGTAAVGRTLLEMYPAAANAGSLFDHCATVLETGQPRVLTGDSLSGLRPQATGEVAPTVRIARFYDGVAISWRAAQDADRLAALLQHSQRLGRIGAWEEDLRTGEVKWTQPTYQLFGLQEADPVALADLDRWVPDEDLPAVLGFRRSLLRERQESAAAFRIIRADDASVRQMRAYAEPMSDGTGALVAVRGAYQDVSADYHTRLAFAAAREQLADTEERAAEDHYLALRLQQAITPPAEPLVTAGLGIAARYRPFGPGKLVGGDWYDTIQFPGGEVFLVVGDVAGHGLDAVTGMVAMRNALRGLAATAAAPATLLGWLNAAACYFRPGVLGTVICGRYEPATQSLTWARAGHLPPVLVRGDQPRILEPPSGMMLGADPDATFTETTTALQSGDTLLLFTDGLIERRDQSMDDAFDGLLRLASHPAGDISRFADGLVDEASSDTEDDACLLAVRVR
jgi:serine phosphatase RsbU (regulator of sigma subunit)/PAS domain-containing protein